ncbi:MAG TPA: cytochrome c oxidase subunit I [Gemmatimonadota bacterium]|jgi:cytochrome c oxidase subunit 1|nr:cytochrome c oxidase subunit I [Gemmatimonadota bacterium]
MSSHATAEAGHESIYAGGLRSWLTTVDHKRIGILYGVTALLYFVVGGVEALIIRLQLASADGMVVGADTFNQLFTMHGTTMIFLVLMPLSAALFNYMIPLMIGARDVAFPRLNAFSFWTFLFGSLLLNLSFFAGHPPDAGWFGYANLTSKQYSPGMGIDFWLLSLQIMGIASIASAVNFTVTILNMRAPGMSLMRTPLFVWMALITQVLMLLAFPAITVAFIFLLFDRFFGTHFYIPTAGGTPILWQHLFWIFGHPEVYILILPSFGVVSEVLPTFSRKPLFGAPFMIFSGILIGFLGFGVWSHHMFATGLGAVADTAFSLGSMLIAIPTGVKVFNWIATLWGGRIRFKTPLYFAVGMVALFIIGGLSGIMHASPPVDIQQTDSYFVVAHLHYVFFGGTIFGLFAGIYYWWPKITGRMIGEGLGKLHFWLMFIGMNLTFFPMHFLGMDGMPRRIYTYAADLGWERWNEVATVGAFVIAVSVLVFFVNAIRSAASGARAVGDPWDAATLEWTMSSPPPEYNFAVVPAVNSARPFWLHKHGPTRDISTHTKEEGTPAQPETPPVRVDLPSPSGWPVLAALGLALMGGGALVGLWLVLIGVAVLVFGVYRWAFQPLERLGHPSFGPASTGGR